MDHNKRAAKLSKLVNGQKPSYADLHNLLQEIVALKGKAVSPVIAAAAGAITKFEENSAEWWRSCLVVTGKIDSELPCLSFQSVAFGQAPREFFRLERIFADETIPEKGYVDNEATEARMQMSRAGTECTSNLSFISYAALAWFKQGEYHAVKVTAVSSAQKWSVVFAVDDDYYMLSFDHTVFKADCKQLEKYLKG
jgi:hypothetical protein